MSLREDKEPQSRVFRYNHAYGTCIVEVEPHVQKHANNTPNKTNLKQVLENTGKRDVAIYTVLWQRKTLYGPAKVHSLYYPLFSPLNQKPLLLFTTVKAKLRQLKIPNYILNKEEAFIQQHGKACIRLVISFERYGLIMFCLLNQKLQPRWKFLCYN